MRKLFLTAMLSLAALSPLASQAQVQVYFPGVRVAIAPPAPRYEVAPPAPSPRHHWIAGYWGWRNNAHVWMSGHWALPPAYGYVWEPARWESINGSWIFRDGHWRPTEQPDPRLAYQPPPPPVEEVVTETPPPPPIEEVHPAPPFAGAIWMPGYWHWNGARHVWVVGRWSPRPAGFEWQQQRWEHRQDGRWVARDGHWHHGGDDRRDDGHRGADHR